MGKAGAGGFCPLTCTAPLQRPSSDRETCSELTFQGFGSKYTEYVSGGEKDFSVSTKFLQVYDKFSLMLRFNRPQVLSENCKGLKTVVEVCDASTEKCFHDPTLFIAKQVDDNFEIEIEIAGNGNNCPRKDSNYYAKVLLQNPSENCFLQGNISTSYTQQTFKVKANSKE